MNKNEISDLFSTCGAPVYRIAKSVTRSEADAEDVVQEIFVKIYQSRDAGQKKISQSYLNKMAFNLSLNRLRDQKRRKEHEAKYMKNKPQYQYEDEQLEELQIELNRLEDKLRLPIVLKFLNKMTYREISDVLNIPQTTISSRVERGLGLLRKNLKVSGAFVFLPLEDLGLEKLAMTHTLESSQMSDRLLDKIDSFSIGSKAPVSSFVVAGFVIFTISLLVFIFMLRDDEMGQAHDDLVDKSGDRAVERVAVNTAGDSGSDQELPASHSDAPSKNANAESESALEGVVSAKLIYSVDVNKRLCGPDGTEKSNLVDQFSQLTIHGSYNRRLRSFHVNATDIFVSYKTGAHDNFVFTDDREFDLVWSVQGFETREYVLHVNELISSESGGVFENTFDKFVLPDLTMTLHKLPEKNGPIPLPACFTMSDLPYIYQHKKFELDDGAGQVEEVRIYCENSEEEKDLMGVEATLIKKEYKNSNREAVINYFERRHHDGEGDEELSVVTVSKMSAKLQVD